MTRFLSIRPAVMNVLRLVVVAGLRNWFRHLETVLPALASLGTVLLAGGVITIGTVALANAVSQQAAQASLVEVYVRDDATPDAVAALQHRLASRPDVERVTYVPADLALARARQRPGLDTLLTDGQPNPFEAEIDVEVRGVASVAAVAAAVNGDPAVDPAYPSSYDAANYSRLTRVIAYAREGAIACVAFLLAVAVAVAVSSVRAAIQARRDEVRMMRLIGSPPWLVLGQFMLEGAFTGLVAGLAAALAIAVAFAGMAASHPVAMAEAVPGVDLAAAVRLALLLPCAGTAVGAASTILGLKRERV